jgi:hypothetical protein
MNESTAIARVDDHGGALVNQAELTPEVFQARIEREGQMRKILKDYVRANMVEGHHFSNALGSTQLAKPMLLQDGTRNICSLFKLYFGEPKIDEKWLDGDHYRVRTHIALFNAEGHQITSGDGICSTRETKYAYRVGQRVCPSCGVAAIFKDNKSPQGGWYCWAKKDGCGAKFEANDDRIVSQQTGRIDNPDKADIENTVLKMSVKRAKAAAVCDVPMVSEIFAPEGDERPKDDQPQRPQSTQSEKPKAAVKNDADDPKVLGETRESVVGLLGVKFGGDEEAIADYLKGRDPQVMRLDALAKMQGDLAAM